MRWAATRTRAQRLGFHIFRLNILVYGYLGFIAGIASHRAGASWRSR